jgi:HAE1 family hydrophobic/amphiphilic exporter-1
MNLTPIEDRTIIADDLIAAVQSELPRDPDKQIYSSAHTVSYGPPENSFPIQIQMYDSDLARIKTFALAVADHARNMPGVNRVSDGYTDGSTNAINITLNQKTIAERGLSTAAVGAQLAGLLGDQTLTKVTLDDNPVDVVMNYTGKDTYRSLQDLKSALIATPTGPAQLGTLASFSQDNGSASISHQNGQRYATVKAQVDADTNAFKTQADLNAWAKDHLNQYHLRSDALESKGEGDDIAKSFGELFTALGIAVVMIYLVLALFFGSFLKPIIITFALPLSFLGVFPILALMRNQFGFLEILGLITLAGIVVNVGIFVIDYANHRVAEGMSVKEAVAQATAVRFRPIFLTKVVALGSLLPLAILSPFWRGLTSVIIAGILTSGILSLFTTPILYLWFSGLAKFPGWLKAKFKRHNLI